MDEKKKLPNRRRGKRFSFYLLDAENEIFELKAQEAGLSKSDLLRNLILFGAAHRRSLFTKEESEKICYELNRIGNNINQIAYRSNALKKNDSVTLSNLLDQYKALLDEFNRIVGD